MSRIIATVFGAYMGGNGLAMLFASFWWYNIVPGVTSTGAFNPHFVRDIGAIYVMIGAGFGWFAWRPRQAWPALAAMAGWLTLHAFVHIYDAACGTRPLADLSRDFVGVFLPALVALALVVRPPAAPRAPAIA